MNSFQPKNTYANISKKSHPSFARNAFTAR